MCEGRLLSPSNGDSNWSDRAGYRAALIGIAIGIGLVMVIVTVSGELDWKWILAAVVASSVMAAFVFAMFRWGTPLARRLRNRLEGIENPPRLKQSEDAHGRSPGQRDMHVQHDATAADPLAWYKRVRFQMVWGLLLPIMVTAAVAAFLGDAIVLIGLGVTLGVGVSIAWLVIWMAQREELEKRGFRW